MEAVILQHYVRELLNQTHSAHLAAAEYNAALGSIGDKPASEVVPRVYAAAQALLGAGAAISKLLWPTQRTSASLPAQQWTESRGHALRAAIGADALTVLRSRAVRNGLEHFDERLDDWLRTNPAATLIDRNIGPRDSFKIEGRETQHLRLLDSAAGIISVLDAEVPINGLVDELVLVRRAAFRWLEVHELAVF